MAINDDTLRSFKTPVDPVIGTVIDEYQIEKILGIGAMGIVYRATHRVIGKPAAMKVLKQDYATDPDMVNRLIQEARAVNAIRHPGIVDIFGFGTLPTGQPYIIMDLLEGAPLDSVIRSAAPMKPKDALPILDDLLGALAAAHQVGVIHRDLKPGNVFVESHPEARSRVKVIDFGLARQADRAGGSVRPTNPGTLLGTPAFMAPEQVVGQKVTPSTDLYAVGGIAYQMLTGYLPHEAPSAIELLSLKITTDPVRAIKKLPSLDPEIDSWIMWLLEREFDRRPQSAEDARVDLRRLIDGRTHSSPSARLANSVSSAVSTNQATQASMPISVPPKPSNAPKRSWNDASTQLVEGTPSRVNESAEPPRSSDSGSRRSSGSGLRNDPEVNISTKPAATGNRAQLNLDQPRKSNPSGFRNTLPVEPTPVRAQTGKNNPLEPVPTVLVPSTDLPDSKPGESKPDDSTLRLPPGRIGPSSGPIEIPSQENVVSDLTDPHGLQSRAPFIFAVLAGVVAAIVVVWLVLS